MTLKNAFGDLALDSSVQEVKDTLGSPGQEATLEAIRELQSDIKTLADTMLILVSALLEKAPRLSGSDQMAVLVESGSIGTVTTVTTCATLTNLSQVGGRSAQTLADAQIMNGTSHIYSNIMVS